MTKRVVRWLIFSVLLALLPLAFAAVLIWSRSTEVTPYFLLESVLEGGELFLISAIIGGEAFGDLIASDTEHWYFKHICGGACLLTTLSSAFWYGTMKVPPAQIPDKVVMSSIVVFAFTLFAAGGCKSLASE